MLSAVGHVEALQTTAAVWTDVVSVGVVVIAERRRTIALQRLVVRCLSLRDVQDQFLQQADLFIALPHL